MAWGVSGHLGQAGPPTLELGEGSRLSPGGGSHKFSPAAQPHVVRVMTQGLTEGAS